MLFLEDLRKNNAMIVLDIRGKAVSMLQRKVRAAPLWLKLAE